MTPRQFQLKTEERAQSIFELTDNLPYEAIYALGMLRGFSERAGVAFSFALLDLACNARSWDDVTAVANRAALASREHLKGQCWCGGLHN